MRRTFLYSCTLPILSPTLAICRVKRVGPGALTVKRSGEEAESVLPFGTCVWATGIAMHPLVGVGGEGGSRACWLCRVMRWDTPVRKARCMRMRHSTP